MPANQQYFIDFRASGGMRLDLGLDATSSSGRMTMVEFCREIGVSDVTLYRWEKSIPQFAELKIMRRKMIYGNRIVDAVWRRSAVNAMKGNSTEIERILNNFDPHYKSPKVGIEADIGGNLMAIFDSMRKEASIIDGELIETEPGTASVDGEERPTDLPSQS